MHQWQLEEISTPTQQERYNSNSRISNELIRPVPLNLNTSF